MHQQDGHIFVYFLLGMLHFARMLAQIIMLRAQFPDHPIKNIHLDNAGEFTSQAFNDYYNWN